MPISKSNKNLSYPVWTPTIKNQKGKTVYEDLSSNLSGYHNSYWEWGQNPESKRDELWVYNSDIGEVTLYFTNGNKWEKIKYAGKKELKNRVKYELPKIIKKKLERYKK